MQFSVSYYFTCLKYTSFSTHFLIADMELDIECTSMRTVTVHTQSVTERMFSFESVVFWLLMVCSLERARYFRETYCLRLQDGSINQTKNHEVKAL
jgi:hypothetical protein